MSAAYQRDPYHGQRDPKDEKDLHVLIVMTKIYAWFCIFSVVMCVGMAAALAYFMPELRKGMSPSDQAEFAIFIPALFVGALWGCGLVWLYFKAASCIKMREGKTWIYVAAALACTNAPLGLALGIYTFVLLERPSIKAFFTS